jgi:Zn-dependent protease with chaperone function
MQTLSFLLGVFYLVMMPILVASWLGFFRQDSNMSKEEKQVSLMVLTIATLLWPIVLPFAYLELLSKFKRASETNRLYKNLLKANVTNSQLC